MQRILFAFFNFKSSNNHIEYAEFKNPNSI